MKKLIISLVMLVPAFVAMSADSNKGKTMQQVAVHTDTAGTEGIVAYSDTTAAVKDSVATSMTQVKTVQDHIKSFDDVSDPFELLAYLVEISSFGATLVAIFFIIFILLFLLSPFLLVGFVLYLLFRNRNRKYKIIEKAMESGQPLPEDMFKKQSMDNDFMRKGIKNACMGVGLMVMFYFFDMDALIGIGALVTLYGVGQIIIACLSDGKKKDSDMEDGGKKKHDDNDLFGM